MSEEITPIHDSGDELSSASSALHSFEDLCATDERVLAAARMAIDSSRRTIANAVNTSMVKTYWVIGKELVEAVGERAAYGRHLIAFLAEHLTAEYGRGFSERTLRDARRFYRTYPKWHAVRAELGWAQYRRIMRVKDCEAREFYASECAVSNWSERELKRQIDTNLYDRLIHTQRARALGDLAQLDFYLNFFDDKFRLPNDGPSIGILLCSQTSDAVARYSSLAKKDNLYAAQYYTYLPTEEELEVVLRCKREEHERSLAHELTEGEGE